MKIDFSCCKTHSFYSVLPPLLSLLPPLFPGFLFSPPISFIFLFFPRMIKDSFSFFLFLFCLRLFFNYNAILRTKGILPFFQTSLHSLSFYLSFSQNSSIYKHIYICMYLFNIYLYIQLSVCLYSKYSNIFPTHLSFSPPHKPKKC